MISGRERKRRRGYTKNLALQIAQFTAGWQMGFDADLLPRHGSGVLEFDLVAAKASMDGQPFEGQMLGWCRDLFYRNVALVSLQPNWVKRAVVKVAWTWLGERYEFLSIGEVQTEDSVAQVRVKNVQPPLPSPMRSKRSEPPPDGVLGR